MIVGGLRARLLKESLFNMINDSLTSLGWFDTGRQHRPVVFRDHGVPDDEEVVPNMVALADDDVQDSDMELGSNFSEHQWTFYVDVYAENDAIGIHLSNDVKAILEGRIRAIGRFNNFFDLVDYSATAATPIIFGSAEITGVSVQRAHGFSKPFQKHWYSVPMLVSDYYGDDADDGGIFIGDNGIPEAFPPDVIDGGPA